MEQTIATLVKNAAIATLSLIALAPALWLTLMAFREAPYGFGASFAFAHRKK